MGRTIRKSNMKIFVELDFGLNLLAGAYAHFVRQL